MATPFQYNAKDICLQPLDNDTPYNKTDISQNYPLKNNQEQLITSTPDNPHNNNPGNIITYKTPFNYGICVMASIFSLAGYILYISLAIFAIVTKKYIIILGCTVILIFPLFGCLMLSSGVCNIIKIDSSLGTLTIIKNKLYCCLNKKQVINKYNGN